MDTTTPSDNDSLFGDTPAPGAPLVYKEADYNRQIIEADTLARANRLQPKLSKKELSNLEKRQKYLVNLLTKIGWNDLVLKRDRLWKMYLDTVEKYKKASGKDCEKLRIIGLKIVKAGNKISTEIEKYKPIVNEFNIVQTRLKAHYDAVRFEIEDRENRQAFRQEALNWLAQIEAACYQSPRLHHKWTDKNGKEHTDIITIEGIDHKPDAVYYKIKISERVGLFPWRRFYRPVLPKGVNVDNLTSDETLANLSAFCRRKVRAEKTPDGSAIFWVVSRLDSTDGTPNLVRYSNIVPFYPHTKHAYAPWIAGISTDRKVETFTFHDAPHMLVAGSTMSGKSTFINGLISTIITMNSPDEARLVLIDNKGGIELSQFEAAKHNLIPMISSPDKVLDALSYLERIMQRRFANMSHLRQRSIIAYNNLVKPESKMPRIFIVVDEMATLAGLEDSSLIQQRLRVLSAQGRAVGMHLILCTQSTNVKIIEGDIKTNFAMRVSGLMPDLASSLSILGSTSATKIPEGVPGRFVFRWGIREIFVQTALITETEIERAVQISNEFPDPVNGGEFVEIEDDKDESEIIQLPVQRFGRDDLLEVVLTNLDGRLSAKNVHEIIGGNDVMPRRQLEAMCKEIVDAGMIRYKNVEYVVKPVRKAKYLVPRDKLENESADTETNPSGNEVLSDD